MAGFMWDIGGELNKEIFGDEYNIKASYVTYKLVKFQNRLETLYGYLETVHIQRVQSTLRFKHLCVYIMDGDGEIIKNRFIDGVGVGMSMHKNIKDVLMMENL